MGLVITFVFFFSFCLLLMLPIRMLHPLLRRLGVKNGSLPMDLAQVWSSFLFCRLLLSLFSAGFRCHCSHLGGCQNSSGRTGARFRSRWANDRHVQVIPYVCYIENHVSIVMPVIWTRLLCSLRVLGHAKSSPTLPFFACGLL